VASALALGGLEDSLSGDRLLPVFHQKLTHCDCNLLQVSLKREVSRWQEFDSSARDVFLERFCSCRDEVWIELAPYREEWRLRGSKVLLELGVQLHIVGIVQEEIELYINVPGTR
jgi:hypothetical protein